MPTLVVLATTDAELCDAWERQVLPGRPILRLGHQNFPNSTASSLAAVVVLDSAAEELLPSALSRCPTIYVGEQRSLPFEQAKLAGRAKIYLTYKESIERLAEFLPLIEELAEKQSMLELLVEKTRRSEPNRPTTRPVVSSAADAAELWDFLEGTVENLDTRDRLITEFRRASRHLLHASHAVFFLREADGFRADRGTSFFAPDDAIVTFFENHPAVIDGGTWEGPTDPVAELAVRNRLALWGARLLAPVHDNGRLLGLIAFGVRDDGQPYDDSDRTRAVFFARLLRHCLSKSAQLGRLNVVAEQAVVGAKYFPSTLVLGVDETAPRRVPLIVRELIGRVRQTREVTRVAPAEGQPFRASAGLVVETGGVWACWEEASGELHDIAARQRVGRRWLLHEIALTLSHELGNGLVSLATLRQLASDQAPPEQLLEAVRADVTRLEALNRDLGLMQTLHEAEASKVDVRDLARTIGRTLGIDVEVGPDSVILTLSSDLIEFAIRALIETIAENRHPQGTRELVLQVRSSGEGRDLTALLSIKGRHLELEGILPEPVDGGVPNQGKLGVFLAKEILRLHHGEIHAGPGIEGTEILISFRSC